MMQKQEPTLQALSPLKYDVWTGELCNIIQLHRENSRMSGSLRSRFYHDIAIKIFCALAVWHKIIPGKI